MSLTETRCGSKAEDGMPGLSAPESLRQGVEQLARFVEMSAQDGAAAHAVEKGIWEHLLRMGRMALGHFFDQVGDGDLGEEVTLSDESIVRRLLFPHTRPYQSIFGPFELSRAVYGSREGQKIGLRASLERSEDGDTQPAMAEIFGWLDSERETRNPDATKPLIVLMDGQRSLWEAAATYFPEESIEILDLLQVTPRLWEAAYLFHPKTGPSAAQFVRQRVLRVLKGESRGVVIWLRRMGTVSGLTGRKRKKLERICRYLENNAHRMQYDQYLMAGYPIATGVIEGACRHLAKDRLERTGMHWVLDGAQAVLDLRSVYLSEQWDAFQKWRIANDNERHDPRGEAFLDAVEWPIAA